MFLPIHSFESPSSHTLVFEMVNLAFVALVLLPWADATPTFNRRDSADCGVRGYDRGSYAYDYDANSRVANYASCSTKCLASSKCKSFAIGSGACLLYAKTVYA